SSRRSADAASASVFSLSSRGSRSSADAAASSGASSTGTSRRSGSTRASARARWTRGGFSGSRARSSNASQVVTDLTRQRRNKGHEEEAFGFLILRVFVSSCLRAFVALYAPEPGYSSRMKQHAIVGVLLLAAASVLSATSPQPPAPSPQPSPQSPFAIHEIAT